MSPAIPVARPRGRLDLLDAGRGLAALAVVVFHANASAPQFEGPRFAWTNALEHGVDFFFLLSGFIIFHTHLGDLGRPEKLREYAAKRFIRLVPALWAVVLLYAVMKGAAGNAPDGWTLAGSLIPWPSLEPASPLVVWTLRHELLFYFMFAIWLVWARAGAALFALWLVATIAQYLAALAGNPVTGVGAFLLSPFNMDFMMGGGLAYAYRIIRFPTTPWPLIAGLILLPLVLYGLGRAGIHRLGLDDYTSPGAVVSILAIGLVFAVIVYGLLALQGKIRAAGWLLLLGDISYSLYLVHTVANSVLQRIVIHLPDSLKAIGAGHILLVLGGCVAGWIVHIGIEKPASRWLRPRLLGKRGSD